MTPTKERPPNPGSAEALALGCRCPVLDNGHGKGSGWGLGAFWISDACELHRRDHKLVLTPPAGDWSPPLSNRGVGAE